MSISVLRTADAWWVALDAHRAVPVQTPATTTAELLDDVATVHTALAEARSGNSAAQPRAIAELPLLSPVTAPCRVVAQMTNYVSHVRDSGMNPRTVPLTFFRKTSGSISGPYDEIVRPGHVRFLDYEIELGLVVGRPLDVGATVTAADWKDHVAGLVITNDVSARDVQLPKTQFYEAKSYPGFTPVGPALVLLEADELDRLAELRLVLKVNGEIRQDSDLTDMIYSPLQALQELSRFQALSTGDLILTGTPGGTALKAPPKPVEIIGALLPPAMKWKAFFNSQAKNDKYLRDGDVVELTIRTPDGAIDLGKQQNKVRFA
ncbi:2-hydroxyhepta-2,4-diene-1,7-dioate isomerase [Streptomyces davaonensis JCM 4913]|uniref:2-hydroxyhepta-2,4-diene-1,7-dioate isomerase n=1 Tax=Streptomyces davaonensis (strain DSM 101723 / JCM 4913 / KCC S-0913 / 768) TaxID=1214101 RepID=K4RFX2_STRDJ|nr:fumarylacetoacetate hydrolase family protein [Streptomyces davaonensis]CCK32587.1 2-hydroxyhepta-2,4-diene-1,7-dioate isomerase [Streptomyces davaonensis JCM 4913]